MQGGRGIAVRTEWQSGTRVGDARDAASMGNRLTGNGRQPRGKSNPYLSRKIYFVRCRCTSHEKRFAGFSCEKEAARCAHSLRSHTCGLSGMFSVIHAPGKHGFDFIFACWRKLCEALFTV